MSVLLKLGCIFSWGNNAQEGNLWRSRELQTWKIPGQKRKIQVSRSCCLLRNRKEKVEKLRKKKINFHKTLKSLPFSSRCPGEILARAEQYIFFVSLIQAFEISAHGEAPHINDYEAGINMHPKPFKINAKPRFSM